MDDMNQNRNSSSPKEESGYSLNDDRRVKTLSPGRLVARRFFRNRVAVTGLVILVFMFIFSFIGGLLTPYKEDEKFYRTEQKQGIFAAVKENTEQKLVISEDAGFSKVDGTMFEAMAKTAKGSFKVKTASYELVEEGEGFTAIYPEGEDEAIAFVSSYVVSPEKQGETFPFEMQYQILKSITGDEETFEYDGKTYEVTDGGGVSLDGEPVAYASRYTVNPQDSDTFLTREFKETLLADIEAQKETFSFTDEAGETAEYTIKFEPATNSWSILKTVDSHVFDTYGYPSRAHWLGTDRNGMDMLTRLMYGGRVSLYIGFIVVIIETLIGVVLGGISGYFGGWVDNLIMRIVDVFYCIPSMPIIIILGAAMDAGRVDPQIRMIYLMLILGFLGWPGIARLVRGQILSLREQEFMTAAEATGLSVHRRIFRHLIPNVIPQLIVTMTMSLGSTIITEATLSFLGLGVKFPFASWGNIINDVNDTYVLTNYWFIWIPAGVCLLLTVLAFNLVGDGLRDAFDPKMKR